MWISHHSHNYVDEAGKVCHCNEDLCNVSISDDDNNNATRLKDNLAFIALYGIAIQVFAIRQIM